MQETIKLVFAGHVDHGKSTLIGRLLCETGAFPRERIQEIQTYCDQEKIPFEYAFVMDALREEREQKITMDMSRIFFQSVARRYEILDVPGHAEFIQHMMTGASQADGAILIVDAAEGIAQQTRRHLYLLGWLGFREIVVVVNKMDLVGYKKDVFEKLRAEIVNACQERDMTVVSVVPVSAREGEGIIAFSEPLSWYAGESLLKTLDGLDVSSEEDANLLFPVQDGQIFEGTSFAVGLVEQGSLSVGDVVFILPQKQSTTVQKLIQWPKFCKSIAKGDFGGALFSDSVKRGAMVVQDVSDFQISQGLSLRIFWMGNQPLSVGDSLELRLSTQEMPCTVTVLEEAIDTDTLQRIKATQIQKLQAGTIRVQTEIPCIFGPGLERCVLTQQGKILAAGYVFV